MDQDTTSQLRERIKELEHQNEQLQKEVKDLKHNEQRVREFGETFISISNRFISANDVDQAIHDSLGDMGQLTGADRAYLFLLSEDGKIMDNTHEWCNTGIKSEIHNLQNLSTAGFPWWMEQLRKGENIHIKNVSDIPEAAKAEKELLESRDIKSFLVVPLYSGSHLKGFTGFDDVRETGDWSHKNTKLLQAFSQIILNALERRQFEIRIQEQNEFIENITHNIFDLISLTDLEGNILFASKSHEILGYDSETLIGTNVMDYVYPEDHPDTENEFSAFIQSGEERRTVEHRILTKDNSYLWFEISASLLKDEYGKPKQLLFSSRDITERKQAQLDLQKKNEDLKAKEEALASSNKDLHIANQKLNKHKAQLLQYKKMVEGSDDMMAVVDKEYNYLLANHAYLKYYRLNYEDIIGYQVKEIIGEQYFEETVQPNIDKALKGETVQYDMIREFVWGSVYFNINYYPLADEEGIEGVVGVFKDITDRKKAEQKVNQARNQAEATANKYRTLIEQSSEMLVLHDLKGQIIEVNQATENKTGYNREELYSMNIRDIHPDAGDIRNWKVLSVEDPPMIFETRHKNKNGDIYPAEVVISKIKLDQKEYILGLARDITERKQKEEQIMRAKEKAEESDRLKSAFLANMSHEIRTPMNGIMGFSQLLQEKDYPKDKRNEFLRIIHSRTQHLLNIINDLVDVSKIEANQLSLKFQYFCLNEVMEELYSVYSNELTSRKKDHVQLRLQLGLSYAESYIESDINRFRQVMDNLLKNAIKFTHKGTIEFGYEYRSDRGLLFYVKDTGTGIPREQQEQIFERFRQVGNETAQTEEGTGLGLTISKNLVEMLGGEMWMNSREGEGSVFYFTLPYSQKSGRQPETEEDTEPDIDHPENKTLLLVEDDPTSFEYIQALLEPHQLNVIPCETGNEAYEAFINNPDIDLILMDIKLPDIDGLDLTRKIRASSVNNKVPVIAQTAYAMSEDVEKSKNAGCNDYISKPIDRKELLEKIRKFI